MKNLKSTEHCMDCEEIIKNDDLDGGSDPLENYSAGIHLCNKKNPRIYIRENTANDKKENDTVEYTPFEDFFGRNSFRLCDLLESEFPEIEISKYTWEHMDEEIEKKDALIKELEEYQAEFKSLYEDHKNLKDQLEKANDVINEINTNFYETVMQFFHDPKSLGKKQCSLNAIDFLFKKSAWYLKEYKKVQK